MSTVDRYIDPATADFVSAPQGAYLLADGLLNQLLMSFLVPLGSWEGDPTLGQRFAELQRATDTPEIIPRVKDLIQAAAQWLLDSGTLVRLDIEAERSSPGFIRFSVVCYPPSGGTVPIGPLFVKVGQ